MTSHTTDYVVVGGGTAGLALAYRLSEDPSVTVLVLEAGQHMPEDPRVNIPAMWPALIGTDVDWAYTSVPQGPIQASFPDATRDSVATAWLVSIRALGYEIKTDPFSGAACGEYTNAATIEPVSKTRSYSANAYYEPVKDRSNLTVVTGAHAERILFDHSASTDSPVATGVSYEMYGSMQNAKASREVVLSAGTFNSPRFLELSGIGSKHILEAKGLQVVYDDPNVGENLQDHFLAGLRFEVRDNIDFKDGLIRREPEAMKRAMENYQTKQFGPFTVGGNYSSALLPAFDHHSAEGPKLIQESTSSNPPDSAQQKELQEYVLNVLKDPQEASGGFFTYSAPADFRGSGSGSEMMKTKMPKNYITICTMNLHPLSRGSTHIVSSDFKEKPTINPRYLTHPLDLDLLARHTRFIEDIVEGERPKVILKPGGKRSPGMPADLRKILWGGVIDPKLRVYGVSGLRVADASIIPIIARGNTMTSVYAIAEKAADLIRESRAR